MDFNSLKEQLALESSISLDEKLVRLQNWIYTHVSTEFFYIDPPQRAFDDACSFVQYYLEVFMPNAGGDIGVPIRYFKGRTALHMAANMGFDRFLDTHQTLSPSAINQEDPYGMRPLDLACLHGKRNTVQILLRSGADPSLCNAHGLSPLFQIVTLPILFAPEQRRNKIALFKMLYKNLPQALSQKDDAGNNLLHMVVINGFVELIPLILEENMQCLYQANLQHLYPIHVAVLNQQLECSKCLLEHAKVAGLTDTKRGNALHFAARYGSDKILRLCLSYYPDLEAKDYKGRTAFLLAARWGNVEAMHLLKDKGAQFDNSDDNGLNALHLAVFSQSIAAVKWLLENTSLDVQAQTYNKEKAIDFCTMPEQEAIKKLLEADNNRPPAS